MFDNRSEHSESEYIEWLCRIRSTGAGRDASGEPSPSRTKVGGEREGQKLLPDSQAAGEPDSMSGGFRKRKVDKWMN